MFRIGYFFLEATEYFDILYTVAVKRRDAAAELTTMSHEKSVLQSRGLQEQLTVPCFCFGPCFCFLLGRRVRRHRLG
jgi:hypothetical protein